MTPFTPTSAKSCFSTRVHLRCTISDICTTTFANRRRRATRRSNIFTGRWIVILVLSTPLWPISSMSTRFNSMRIFTCVQHVSILTMCIVFDRVGGLAIGVGVVRASSASAFHRTQLRLESRHRTSPLLAICDPAGPPTCDSRTAASVCSCSRVFDAVVARCEASTHAVRCPLAVRSRVEHSLENGQRELSVGVANRAVANEYGVSAAALSFVPVASFRTPSSGGTGQADYLVARRTRVRLAELHHPSSEPMLSVLSIDTQGCGARQTLGTSRQTHVVELSTPLTDEDHHRLQRRDHHLALTTAPDI